MFVPLLVATAALHRSDVEKDISTQPVDSCGLSEMTAADDDAVSSAAVMHRKHKKIHRSSAAAAAAPALQDSSLGTEGQVPVAPANPFRKPANPYVAYRNIKMKVNGCSFALTKVYYLGAICN